MNSKERLFYSPDKTRIIYIYKNSSGSYSVGYERMTIADDHERRFINKYDWLEPDYEIGHISFYGTKEEAFNDIKTEVINFIEYRK